MANSYDYGYEISTNDTQSPSAGYCEDLVGNGIATAIAFMGIIGNLLTVFVTVNHRPRSVYTIFLALLSVADGIVSASTFTGSLKILITPCIDTFENVLPSDIIHDIFQLTSNWILVAMTIDRSFAISNVFQRALSKRRLVYVVAGILAASTIIVPLRFLDRLGVPRVVYGVVDISVRYVIPLIILFTMNLRLLYHVRRARDAHVRLTRDSNRSTKSEQENGSDKSRNNKTYIVILVVVVFLICGTTRGTVMIALTSGAPVPEFWTYSSYILMVINSSVNFLIYVLFYEKFRRQLKLSCRCRKNNF